MSPGHAPGGRLGIAGRAILILGLAASGLIFATTEPTQDDADASPTRYSKAYVHELRVYGGRAAVYADDFNRWFEGLWQGRSLAYTVAVLSIGIGVGCIALASRIAEAGSGDEI